MNKRQVGSSYEDMAAAYLIDQGYELIERNYKSRYGEIDIIAWDGAELVFIEVKYRHDSRMGEPAEAVGYQKQQRIRNTARYYLYSCHDSRELPCRFDVVGILGDQINLIKAAF